MTGALRPPIPVPKGWALRQIASNSCWTDKVWTFDRPTPGTPKTDPGFAGISDCRMAEIRKDIRIRSQRRPKTEDKVAELLETNRELNLRIRRLTTINASLHVELNEARKRI